MILPEILWVILSNPLIAFPVEEFPPRVPTGKKKDQTMKTFLF